MWRGGTRKHSRTHIENGYGCPLVVTIVPYPAEILHDFRQRDGQFIRLRVAEGESQRALRVCVNEQHPLVLLGKPDAEIGGGRGLAHAALLVRHRDHFAIRHMGFLLCINLAACGEADGYVRVWKKPSAFLQMA